MVGTGDRQNVANYLKGTYKISITRACKVICLPKSMFYYPSVKDDSQVANKLLEMAALHPREAQSRQWPRVHLFRIQSMVWGTKNRASPHSARKTDAEWVYRTVQ